MTKSKTDIKKGTVVEVVEDLDFRKLGTGPFIPKGTKGTAVRAQRDGRTWVKFETFGIRCMETAKLRRYKPGGLFGAEGKDTTEELRYRIGQMTDAELRPLAKCVAAHVSKECGIQCSDEHGNLCNSLKAETVLEALNAWGAGAD